MGKQKLEILSATLAEIYMRQGHLAKAKDVYGKLLAREPDNLLYKTRLALLSQETEGRRRLNKLASLLKKIEDKRDERETAQ
jgi:hypothetical protein